MDDKILENKYSVDRLYCASLCITFRISQKHQTKRIGISCLTITLKYAAMCLPYGLFISHRRARAWPPLAFVYHIIYSSRLLNASFDMRRWRRAYLKYLIGDDSEASRRLSYIHVSMADFAADDAATFSRWRRAAMKRPQA